MDPERLDVYQLALEFQPIAAAAIPVGHAALRNQLERASASILLNTAEGSARRLPLDKGHFYAIARGSAAECFAVYDLLRVRALVKEADYFEARRMLVLITEMLARLETAMLRRANR